MDILFQQSALAMGRERPIPSATVALVADFSVKQLALSILFIENLIEYAFLNNVQYTVLYNVDRNF